MKLFLTSSGIAPDTIDALKAILPGPPAALRLCHIVTAAMAEPDHAFVTDADRVLQEYGFATDLLDVAGWRAPDLAAHLARYDILYVEGGNTFHLLDRMRQSGADAIIRRLVTGHGKVYCGVSAGSIVAGADIAVAGWSPHWDRNEVGLTDTRGLGLVCFAISPHYVAEDGPLIAARLPLPYPILALRDGQAWVVDGERQCLVPEAR